MGHGKKLLGQSVSVNTYTISGYLGSTNILSGSLRNGNKWTADLSALAAGGSIGGSVSAGFVPYASSADTLADAGLLWNDTAKTLTVSSSVAGYPSLKLKNSDATSFASGLIVCDETDSTRFEFGFNNNTDENYIWAYGDYPIKIATNGNERIRVAGDGKVGIGTIAPTAILDVSGSLVKKVRTVSDADDAFTTTDYHVHMTNARDPGVTITGTLPTAVTGKEIIVTSFVVVPTVSGENKIFIVPGVGDTINGLSTTTINTDADNNYDTFIFRAIDENEWVGAKMEALT